MAKPERIVSINTKENPSEAFDRIMEGVDLLADAVKQTLGPHGRNFLLEKTGTRITNDGITIAREVQARDEIADLGVRLVREAAIKTNEEAGDGTTTATVLTQAALHEGAKRIARKGQFAKQSVLSIRKQIEEETEIVVKGLQDMATPVETVEDLYNVAMVSVEDEELARLISEAQFDLGPHGRIVVEESTQTKCEIERVNGIQIDNGLGTSVLMNDPERHRLLLHDVPVLMTNYQIQDIQSVQPAINGLVQKGHTKIVLLARAFSSDAIRQIMQNFQNGIEVYPMNAPYVNQREVMYDLQAILGGTYIHDEGNALDDMTSESAGFASVVQGYMHSAVFTGTTEEKTEIRVKERASKLRQEAEGEPSKYNKEAILKRVAQLEGGFSLLKVGSSSDTDRKYKYDKAEDAVNTVRSAFQEGMVPGAGKAFLEVLKQLPDDALLRPVLEAPHKQIIANAGEEIEVPEWVKNSVKTDRVAFENAMKVAANLITAGGAIATEKVRAVDQLVARLSDE